MKHMVDGQWVEEGIGHVGKSSGDFTFDVQGLAREILRKKEREKQRRYRRKSREKTEDSLLG